MSPKVMGKNHLRDIFAVLRGRLRTLLDGVVSSAGPVTPNH
jgi:hypothetical protein